MKALPIVKLKISTQARDGLRRGFVITDVDVFVFDASPEPLNEDVVQRPASPIHAERGQATATDGRNFQTWTGYRH